MHIIFLGSGAFALPTLQWLTESDHHIRLVVTQPARPSGRGRRMTPTAVRGFAEKCGIESLEVEDVNAPTILDRLRSLGGHVGVVVAFGQKLSSDLLKILPAGFINLHASLLPRYRGAAPINWAILRGEPRTGCSVFRIVERMDAGPLLVSRSTAIEPEETAGELHDRLAELGVEAVRAALQTFADDVLPEGQPQDQTMATYARKLAKADGVIRFDRPARDVVRHILGMSPWPGASTRFCGADGRQERVTLTRARCVNAPRPPDLSPGTIDERRYVAAGDELVEILDVQPSSGRRMTWSEYVNGRHVEPGDTFMPPEG